MSSRVLQIRKLIRLPQSSPADELVFKPGVNVIVGKPNTGKTKWLNMLDYVMGDLGQPEDAFGQGLAEKYDSIRAIIRIGDNEHCLERRWKQQGMKGKVLIDGAPLAASEFSQYMLKELGIPILHFPKGSPYLERAWPELSWRTLLRHVYRQQRFWSDLANEQPEGDQYACLMQFLGIAEHLFSDDYRALAEKRRNIWQLQVTRDQFLSMLEEISKELVKEKETRVVLTTESINSAILRLKSDIQELGQKRNTALAELRLVAEKKTASADKDERQSDFERLGGLWSQLQTEKEQKLTLKADTERRLQELHNYETAINNELSKMERARGAGLQLANLKATHCPVCDQPIKRASAQADHCFLCGQPWSDSQQDSSAIDSRIDIEMDRLREELTEAEILISRLSDDLDQRVSSLREIEEEINRVEGQLRPFRQAAAAILPPDLTVTDMESGRLQERVRQLQRIEQVLERRKKISAEIDRLQNEEESLRTQLEQASRKIDFAHASDNLADGMNNYLNALEALGTKLWTQQRVFIRLKPGNFDITIGGENWQTKLGQTLIFYFLLSYHYALLRLTIQEGCHYPGLVILDLPATLQDGSLVKDKENFIVEPFVHLVNKPRMEATQVIVAGAAFEGLEGANRIELNTIWV
jgi:predicted  nucleic acid-binding Zn-ribbon protein